MKKAKSGEGDLRSEYRFDYATSRPNRFNARVTKDSVAVVLEPDVASEFKTSAAVNRALRKTIQTRRAAKKKVG